MYSPFPVLSATAYGAKYGQSKICGRQPLKKFEMIWSTNFTRSILEYFVPYNDDTFLVVLTQVFTCTSISKITRHKDVARTPANI